MGTITEYFIEILLSLLTLSFSVWAVTVRSMGVRALALLNELKVRMIELGAAHASLEKRVDSHVEKPWHATAGEEISALRARVNAMQDHMRSGDR